VHIVEDDNGEPLNVGRKTRSIPPAIMRALHRRDGGCRFPGCTCTQFVDGHHIHHWADGGETKLSNLVLLCRFHHRLVHEGGFAIQVLDDGALRFLRLGLDITPRTIVSRWRGERMDYDIAIEGLMRRDGLAV
jgi:hypothetical protein